MRRILLPAAIGTIALSIAACGNGGSSTSAQMEMSRLTLVAAGYKTATDACYQKITENPAYAPLRSKTVVDAREQFTLQMLNDKVYPNKREVSLLSRLYVDFQECRKPFMESVAQTLPQSQNIFVESFSNTDRVWAQVTGGRLTWGQFNQSRKDDATQREEALNQATSQVDAQLQQENQTELAQQQQARAAAIANMQAGLKRAGDAYANMPMPQRPIQCNTMATGGGNSSTTCQ